MADQPPSLPVRKPPSLWRESLEEHGSDERPDGIHIGGWLYLLAAGHVIAFVVFGCALFKDVNIFSQPGIWLNLTTPGTYVYDPMWAKVITYETTGNAAGLICCIVSLFLMVGHKRAYRPWVIGYFMGAAAFAWGDFLLVRLIHAFQSQALAAGLLGALGSTFYLTIWVSYMLVSKRVKDTFVQ